MAPREEVNISLQGEIATSEAALQRRVACWKGVTPWRKELPQGKITPHGEVGPRREAALQRRVSQQIADPLPGKIAPQEEGHLAEKGLSSKRIYSAGKDHSGERGHPSKKKRQLSSKKGSTEKKFCSGESIAFHDSYTDEDSNTGENACYVEEGHHSMVQGIRVETLSSGSMPTVPVQEHVKNTPKEESNTGENASSVEKGHHSMEQDIRIEKHSSGSIRTVPVPEHMNTPVNRIGSATSQVAQVSHQNVAGAVTTGQHMQAANLIMGVELKWPQVLKACLVEDWDLVNNQKQLFQLPAEKNVDHILANYVTFVKSQGKSDNTVYSIVELLYTTREYFNKILGTQLLSQFEKPQYAEMLLAYPDIPISRIYGAPHLLRLLVNIGAELAHWSLSRQSLMSVSSYMHSFLNFLAENSTSLFSSSNYKMASPEYCFKAL
ncbi:MRG containing protein [Cricetulus griseus]|uniref:MRG containing protein n=3 Tax=Cricetulus griseus TaxID=10029 RepID=A0A061I129_CRIGR|nr:MRG containing protein [Cricetulus griseus]